MRPARALAVSVLLAALAGAELWDIVSFGEDWPFSRYAMFAGGRVGPLRQRHVLYGVDAGGAESLLVAPRALYPLDVYKLDAAFSSFRLDELPASRLSSAEAERLRGMLADILRRYEAGRVTGKHAGPTLVGLRLYLMSRHAGERALVFEVTP